MPRYPRWPLKPGRRPSAAWPTAWESPPSTSGTTRNPFTTSRARTPWAAFPGRGSSPLRFGMSSRSASWSAPGPTSTARAGVASMEDAVQMMMCGADSIGVCTETMISGFGFLEKWMKSLKDYMKKMGLQTAGGSSRSADSGDQARRRTDRLGGVCPGGPPEVLPAACASRSATATPSS